jgi:hypothetical protein
MFSFAPSLVDQHHCQDTVAHQDYYCVEFDLNGSHPVYQFKLWHSDRTPHFFLLKETSALSAQLKVGDILPMKYYCDDTMRTIEQHQTRIEAIFNETRGRFKGHFRIKLNILGDDTAQAMRPTSTDC